MSDNADSQTPTRDDLSFADWIRQEVESEEYWFHKIDLGNGLVTPGWSDPREDKLPYYGLPEDLTGARVLDIGCAEGFFSFECERRGAAEVIAIDSFADSVRRFNICRTALGSKATAFLTNVYDLKESTFGTFDLVLFYGVLYHLRHPLLALEKILEVCSGTMLLQTAIHEEPGLSAIPMAKYHPRGMESGTADKPFFDPTVFWLPNREAVRAMAFGSGFDDVQTLSENDFVSIVSTLR